MPVGWGKFPSLEKLIYSLSNLSISLSSSLDVNLTSSFYSCMNFIRRVESLSKNLPIMPLVSSLLQTKVRYLHHCFWFTSKAACQWFSLSLMSIPIFMIRTSPEWQCPKFIQLLQYAKASIWSQIESLRSSMASDVFGRLVAALSLWKLKSMLSPLYMLNN